MTEEQKQIACSKARIAADDIFRSLEELTHMGHIPARREHAHLQFITAVATLVASVASTRKLELSESEPRNLPA